MGKSRKPQVNLWRRCADELPPVNEPVVIAVDFRPEGMIVARWDGFQWIASLESWHGLAPTYWLKVPPLPPPRAAHTEVSTTTQGEGSDEMVPDL